MSRNFIKDNIKLIISSILWISAFALSAAARFLTGFAQWYSTRSEERRVGKEC